LISQDADLRMKDGKYRANEISPVAQSIGYLIAKLRKEMEQVRRLTSSQPFFSVRE